jgi:hypothetical protein
LKKYRKKIGRKCSLRDYQENYDGVYQDYTSFQNELIIEDKKENKIIKNLKTTLISDYKEAEIKYIFKRENTLEEIISYLKNQKANNLPLKFWYRSDIRPREVDDYYVGEKYLQVKYKYNKYYIKFLIDKIRKI